MLVDTLLEHYGVNPAAYPNEGDKWIVIFSETLLSLYVYIPIIFFLIPLIYLFIKRKKYKGNRKKLVKRAILYPIVGVLFGGVLIYIILAVMASLAAYSLYGGAI